MDIHKNARLTPLSRAELVRRVLEERQTQTAVAKAFGVPMPTGISAPVWTAGMAVAKVPLRGRIRRNG